MVESMLREQGERAKGILEKPALYVALAFRVTKEFPGKRRLNASGSRQPAWLGLAY